MEIKNTKNHLGGFTMEKNYTIIDIETTGLTKDSKIIELCAVRVTNGEVEHKFSTLINPRISIPEDITLLTGITNDMVVSAPTIDQAFRPFLNFLGSSLLVGYNIKTFDIPILMRYADMLHLDFNYDFIDIYNTAKDKLSHLPNLKLSTVATFFLIDTTGSHRAFQDCLITKEVYEKLENYVPDPIPTAKSKNTGHKVRFTEQTKSLQQLQSLLLGIVDDNMLTELEVEALKKWIDDNEQLSGQFPYDPIKKEIKKALEDGILEKSELEDMLLLFKSFVNPSQDTDSVSDISFKDKICVLTGDFKSGSKAEIEKNIVSKGGYVKSGVSKKTDFVIVGSFGSAEWKCGNYGTKIKKAKELQADGAKVQIISEDSYLEMIGE
jgi:DNA polymerase III epsilon subunit family exonuclease